MKLYFVSSREMIPQINDPKYYATESLELFHHVPGTPHHPVGASLVMALSRSLGLPYRPFQEILLAIALSALLLTLCRSRAGFFSAAVIYTLCLFNPGGALLMDIALSDGPFLIFVAFAWAGILMAAQACDRSALLIALSWTVVAAALAGITRSEAVVFVSSCVCFGVVAFLLLSRIDRREARNTVFACLAAIVGFVGAEQTVNAINAGRYGFWGASYVESSQWWTLYGALLSLPGDRVPGGTFTGRDVIRLAGELSPTFDLIRPCLEKADQFEHWRIHWAIAGCFGNQGRKQVAKTSQIVAEIKSNAAKRGIELRPPLLNLIPRPVARWLPQLPEAIRAVLAATVEVPRSTKINYAKGSHGRTMPEARSLLPSGRVTQKDRSLFARALLMRQALSATKENPNLPYLGSITIALYRSAAFAGLPAAIILSLVSIASYFFGWDIFRLADKQLILIGLLASTFVIFRLALYILIEWMLWGIRFRYAFGIQFFYAIPVVVLFVFLSNFVRDKWFRRQDRGESAPTPAG